MRKISQSWLKMRSTTALAMAACNTVRGAARDVNSVANCTENAINGSQRC